jgi:hypothetical protein
MLASGVTHVTVRRSFGQIFSLSGLETACIYALFEIGCVELDPIWMV